MSRQKKTVKTLPALVAGTCLVLPLVAWQQEPSTPANAEETKAMEQKAGRDKQEPPAGGEPKPFKLPQPQRFTLANGLEVTMVPYGSVPKVTVDVVIRAGNINEAPDEVWLADVTGDLMKEGTARRRGEELAERAASMGGAIEIGVSPDETTVASDALSEFGPELVALLAEVVTQPALPESELERIKTDKLRLLSIEKSQPSSIALERFRSTLYPNHPYGRVFPTEEMIRNFSIEDVREFYRANFNPVRTDVYVAGRFDGPALKKAVEQSFGQWQKGKQASTRAPQGVQKRSLQVINRPGARQSTLYLGLPVVDPSNRDYIPLLVTNTLLGGSFGSRITANIREDKGYTYSPYSSISSRYRDAYWVQVADVTTEVTGPSIREIFFEIDRLRQEPPPEPELRGIQNYLAGIFVLQNSSPQGVIGQLRFVNLHGLSESYLESYVQRIHAVTGEQVREMARKYIDPDKMTIVVVGDQEKIAEQIAPYQSASRSGENR